MSDLPPPPPPSSPDHFAPPPGQAAPAAAAPDRRPRTPLLIAVVIIAVVAVGAAVLVSRSDSDSGGSGLASACSHVETAFGTESMAEFEAAMWGLSQLQTMTEEDFTTATMQDAADSVDVLADTLAPFGDLLAELDASDEFNESDPESGVHELRVTMDDALAGLRETADLFRSIMTIDDLASSADRLMVLSEEMNTVGGTFDSLSSSPSVDEFLMGIPECASMIDTLGSL